MARGASRANSEESMAMRRKGQALINKAEAIEADERAIDTFVAGVDARIAKESARNLEPGRDPMRALNTTASLFLDAKPPADAKDFELERFNRQMNDAKERFMKVKEVQDSSKNNQEFFVKLGDADVKSIEGNYSVEKGLLYNGSLDGKQRAEQFLQSVKEGLKEGAFGDEYRGAKVTFKGTRKDEVRIDLPDDSPVRRRSDLAKAIQGLGKAMTRTQTEQFGDGFGHTPMPKVTFRVAGTEVDFIGYM